MASVVRASKFRHVHGSAGSKEQWYESINGSQTAAPDSNLIAANTKYFAMAWRGGGGPFIVHPLSKTGKLASVPKVLQGHSGPVQDLDFSPFYEEVVASASEDSTVKIWNIKDKISPSSVLEEDLDESSAAALTGHSKKVTLVRFNPVASDVLVSASFDNTLKIWDCNKATEAFSMSPTEEGIQHVCWNYNGSSFAFSSKDKKIRVCDPRTDSVAATFDGHQGAKGTRLCYLGKTNLLASIGFSRQSERQIYFWDVRGSSQSPLQETMIDQASGTLLPFFDADTNILYLAGKGDGNTRYYEIVDSSPYLHYIDQFTGKEPQRGLCFVPKRALNTEATEIGRALRLCNTHVEPVSFQVPRKAASGNNDLYPDTFAGKPSLTPAEWIGGKNADPILVAMATASSAPAPEAPAPEPEQPKETKSEEPPATQKAEAPAETPPPPAPEETGPSELMVEIKGTGPGGVQLTGTLNLMLPDTAARLAALEAEVKSLKEENASLKAQLAAK